MRRVAYIFTLFLTTAAAAQAQQIRTRGYGESDLDLLLSNAIADNPRIITRDTLIKQGDTIRGNVFVVRSRFIVEGTILGDLTAVHSNVYLRPTAVVQGRVINAAGGLYPSELAKTGSVIDRPLAPYFVVMDGDVYVIEGMTKRPALKLMAGMQMPEYNRVDGLRAEIGPSLLLPPVAGFEPSLTGSIGYATERKDLIWRAQLGLERNRSSFTAGYESDITRTRDDWIRGAAKNSLSFIWNGKDYRNYYAADRAFAEFRRVVEKGDRTTQYWVTGQKEIARPLIEGDPFVVLKPDSVRFNPRVQASTVSSVIVGGQSAWTGLTSLFDVSAAFEFAGSALDGDHAFNAFQVSSEYAMQAIANHTLKIVANFRGPLPGTDELPRQRWTFVGGSGTLYTFDVGQFPGDRLAFVETEYRIPFPPRVKVPLIGKPTLRLMHNIGMAWSRDDNPGFEQNVGVRIQFPFVFVRVIANPKGIDQHVKFAGGVSLAGKAYPWEKKPK